MFKSDDRQSIIELRRMAQLYELRGQFERAHELLDLANRIETRLERENQVVDLNDYRIDCAEAAD